MPRLGRLALAVRWRQAMKIDSLEKLFVHHLKDLHSAEKQILEGLEKMEKKATSEELRDALRQHHEETQTQLERLEEVFEELDNSPNGPRCKGVAGLIEEGEELLKSDADGALLDAAIIGAAQKIEHYEIAAYGTAIALAKQLGFDDLAAKLHETLEEEKETDEKLTELAKTDVNEEAMSDS